MSSQWPGTARHDHGKSSRPSTVNEWRPEPDGLARSIGVGTVYYKDGGGRFGLGTFKALGSAYAVLRLLQARIATRTGRTATSAQITRGDFRDVALSITVTCATDGNHGCSVS